MLSFKSFDEVIERANDNDLGLCSYICTNSMEKAHRASELMETGTVAVNTGFVAIAEATQQSARPDMISQQQSSPLGKFILAFQNTPSQYNRFGIKKPTSSKLFMFCLSMSAPPMA